MTAPAAAAQYQRSLFNSSFYGIVPPGGIEPAYPVIHAILFNTTSITLSWANPAGANKFEVQVSTNPDFSGSLMRDDATLTINTTTFTDTGTNATKRWWRWRWSANSGTNWSAWSHVGSYWLDTGAAQSVSIDRNSWMLINPSPVTDQYVFEILPFYKQVQQNMYRVKDRNRLATLLSEYITTKGMIDLSFDESRWLESEEVSELRRFNVQVKTFYLGMFHDYELKYPVPNIWKVQFVSDPDVVLFAAGRQDMLVGTLSFEEV